MPSVNTAHIIRFAEPDQVASGVEAACTIGDLAREFDVTFRALRFYEKRGLISPRRQGLVRTYSESDRARLRLILKSKKLGFTLAEISQMLAAQEGKPPGSSLPLSRQKCVEQIRLLERQKHEIETALAELRRLYSELFITTLAAERARIPEGAVDSAA